MFQWLFDIYFILLRWSEVLKMCKYAQKGPKLVNMGPKEVKRCQKGSNGAKIYISRTFGHRSLVDLSFQSERSCFFKCFIYFITLSWPEVLKNAKIGSKETIKMSEGAKIYISRNFGWAKFFEKGDLNHDRPVFYFRVRIKVSGLN